MCGVIKLVTDPIIRSWLHDDILAVSRLVSDEQRNRHRHMAIAYIAVEYRRAVKKTKNLSEIIMRVAHLLFYALYIVCTSRDVRSSPTRPQI